MPPPIYLSHQGDKTTPPSLLSARFFMSALGQRRNHIHIRVEKKKKVVLNVFPLLRLPLLPTAVRKTRKARRKPSHSPNETKGNYLISPSTPPFFFFQSKIYIDRRRGVEPIFSISKMHPFGSFFSCSRVHLTNKTFGKTSF